MSRHLLVTGGSRGIGAAVVRGAVAAGDRVTFTFRERADAADALVAELGPAVRAVRGDTATLEAEALLADAVAAFGPLDVLVNNAGVTGPLGPFAELRDDDVQRLFEVNVFGVLRLCRAAVAHWRREERGGVIVNVGSIAAATGAPGEYIAYAGSKAALEAITRGLGRELAPDGIRVVAVVPGTTDTEIHAAAGDPDRPARVATRVPLGRVARPEEIAEGVLWAASERASYLTATSMTIAGGL